MKNIKQGTRFWCWWKSRYLYFAGRIGDKYKFVDICDAVTILGDKDLEKLVRR